MWIRYLVFPLLHWYICVSCWIIVNKLGIRDQVRWPPKTKVPASSRDRNKWCEFHNDHDHNIDECIALCCEVVELLKKWHLVDLFTERGWQNWKIANDPIRIPQNRRNDPPLIARWTASQEYHRSVEFLVQQPREMSEAPEIPPRTVNKSRRWQT